MRYATRVGWANNGYFAGDLVTAAAICVAESTGDPKLYVCDNAAGQIVGHGDVGPGKPVTCPAGTVSYDRGLWQLNTVVPGAVSDTCAFDPVCNAKTAYLASGAAPASLPGRPTTKTSTPVHRPGAVRCHPSHRGHRDERAAR